MIFLRIFRRASLPNPVCVCLYFCRTCMVLVRRSSCLCPACWTTPVWAASSTWPWRTPRCPSSRRAPTLCGASRRTWRTSEHTRTHTQPWCRDACRHAHTPFLTPPLSLRLYCSYFEGQYQCFFLKTASFTSTSHCLICFHISAASCHHLLPVNQPTPSSVKNTGMLL